MEKGNNNKERYKDVRLVLPDGSGAEGRRVLLHACCAPCSAAIVECMLRNGMKPTIFYSNSNISPLSEYDLRRSELERHLRSLGVPLVEDVYDHGEWLHAVAGLENEPERGRRCLRCFRFRLERAASYAVRGGFGLFATTLASSRWKDLGQIGMAGDAAAATAGDVTFWHCNWRKNGLQERRAELLRLCGFYNQQYCGCEFSRTASERQCRERDRKSVV